MKAFLVLLVFSLGALKAVAQWRVPFDRASVMIDGRFDAREWQKALRLEVNDSTAFFVKQDEENLYFCLRAATPQPALVMVDFYLAHGGGQFNLHASAKLGERRWNGTSYGEWLWWNNHQWQANVSRLDKPEERRFLRDEAKEFQVRKARFSGQPLRLMFDVSYPPNMVMRYPPAADTAASGAWLQLRL